MSPRWLLRGCRASHFLLSRPATFQIAGLCRVSGYCYGVGRPISSCHAPQQFKSLGCVASVVIVRVSGVPSPPVTSRNSSNRYAVLPGDYSEGVGRPINFSQVRQQFKPLGCVVPVVTVTVSGVPSQPDTSRNNSNRWAVSPRWLL
jgi:hypothetical protein